MIDEEVGIMSLRRSKLSLEILLFMLEQKKKLEAKRKEISADSEIFSEE